MPVENFMKNSVKTHVGVWKCILTEYQCFVSLVYMYSQVIEVLCNVPNIIYQLMIFRLGGFLLY